MEHFRRYLIGKGHPNHQMFSDYLGKDMSNTEANSLRARLFLKAIADSEYLPYSVNSNDPYLEVSHY